MTRILVRKLGILNKSNDYESITMAQCHCLVEIGRNKNLSLKQLSEILNLDTSTTSKTVETLVKKTYVVRKADTNDRRYIVLDLSLNGKELFDKIEKEMNNKFDTIFSKASEEEKEILIKALEIYNKILD